MDVRAPVDGGDVEEGQIPGSADHPELSLSVGAQQGVGDGQTTIVTLTL